MHNNSWHNNRVLFSLLLLEIEKQLGENLSRNVIMDFLQMRQAGQGR